VGYKAEIEALTLGSLVNGPLHGYRIAQAIRAKSEGALKAGDNQIYPVLHRLESEGLVVAEWEVQQGKPSRKLYGLTDQGSKRLEHHRREWKRYADNFSAALGLGGTEHA
jgi:PadR family transcriptional regulator, regulatory protein PadR